MTQLAETLGYKADAIAEALVEKKLAPAEQADRADKAEKSEKKTEKSAKATDPSAPAPKARR